MGEALETAKEGAWREVAAIDAAYESGELDEKDGTPLWRASSCPPISPPRRCRAAREAAVTKPDGSTPGHLSPTRSSRDRRSSTSAAPTASSWRAWARWGAGEPYGLEISPELAELARRRLPEWADRIWVGNAVEWEPPHRFDAVRAGLDYVPAPRRRRLVEHLLSYSRRLVIGVFSEERDMRSLESEVADWGFAIAGRSERLHPHPRLAYRAFWIDAG